MKLIGPSENFEELSRTREIKKTEDMIDENYDVSYIQMSGSGSGQIILSSEEVVEPSIESYNSRISIPSKSKKQKTIQGNLLTFKE